MKQLFKINIAWILALLFVLLYSQIIYADTIPHMPQNLKVEELEDRNIKLTWDAGIDTYSYRVEYVKGVNEFSSSMAENQKHGYFSTVVSASFWEGKKKKYEYRINNLDPKTRYIFRVRGLKNGSSVGSTVESSYVELKYTSHRFLATDFWKFGNFNKKLKKKYFTDWGIGDVQADAYLSDSSCNGTTGNCAGMALAGMAIYYSEFDAPYRNVPTLESYGVSNVSKIGKRTKSSYNNMSALEYIQRLQAYMKVEQMMIISQQHYGDLATIYSSIKNSGPLCIKLRNVKADGHGSLFLHMVVGLYIAEDTGNEVKIKIYDPNYPNNKEKYLILKRPDPNIETKFSEWNYYETTTKIDLKGRNGETQEKAGTVNDLITYFSVLDYIRFAYGTRPSFNTHYYKLANMASSSLLGTVKSDHYIYADKTPWWFSSSRQMFSLNGTEDSTIRYYSVTVYDPVSKDNLFRDIVNLVYSFKNVRKDTQISTLAAQNGIILDTKVNTDYEYFFSNDYAHSAIVTPRSNGTFTISFVRYSGKIRTTTDVICKAKKGKKVLVEQTSDTSIHVKGADSVSIKRTSGTVNEEKWKSAKSYSVSADLDTTADYLAIASGSTKLTIKRKNETTGKYNEPVTTKKNSGQGTGGTKIKKGTTQTVGSFKYQVTKVTSNGGTVTLINVRNKEKSSYSVPKTVKIGGKSFTVNAIGKEAFKNCKKAKKITLTKNISKIGKQAFKGTYNKLKVIVPKAYYKRFKKMLKKKGLSKQAKIVKK